MQQDNQANRSGPLAQVLSIFNTSIGRKIMTGLTGLALVGFVLGHLAGNLTLFFGAEAFNAYAHKLESLGPLLYVIELGLVAVFVFHIVFTVLVTLQNKKARSQHHTKYVEKSKAGKPSRKSLSSQTMIYTGIILGLFTVIHVAMFKYGAYYEVAGKEHYRDLYRLVVEEFKRPEITLGYVAVMVLLGVHVRHGFWSAFQSLGAYHSRYTPLIYGAGILLAVALAVGFLALPIYIFLFVDPVSASATVHAIHPNL